ncbi:hypothetical protein BDY21DRAFT_216866 [Lineolata rhizophorae]|uniref:Uncharacterized protein n=1 Tax=Lineolata rhizophorae TaxID=578093 RepID=A0A6A6P2M4_9PEZI|nr:hypothetical protein BDY21DRAFT_216866 [Lineolata rhizophorae]
MMVETFSNRTSSRVLRHDGRVSKTRGSPAGVMAGEGSERRSAQSGLRGGGSAGRASGVAIRRRGAWRAMAHEFCGRDEQRATSFETAVDGAAAWRRRRARSKREMLREALTKRVSGARSAASVRTSLLRRTRRPALTRGWGARQTLPLLWLFTTTRRLGRRVFLVVLHSASAGFPLEDGARREVLTTAELHTARPSPLPPAACARSCNTPAKPRPKPPPRLHASTTGPPRQPPRWPGPRRRGLRPPRGATYWHGGRAHVCRPEIVRRLYDGAECAQRLCLQRELCPAVYTRKGRLPSSLSRCRAAGPVIGGLPPHSTNDQRFFFFSFRDSIFAVQPCVH